MNGIENLFCLFQEFEEAVIWNIWCNGIVFLVKIMLDFIKCTRIGD